MRKLYVFERHFQPFSLPFQKGLKESTRKLSIFRFFFFPQKRSFQFNDTLGSKYTKKMKLLYCDIINFLLKMYYTNLSATCLINIRD